jgi:hypothetical protein
MRWFDRQKSSELGRFAVTDELSQIGASKRLLA